MDKEPLLGNRATAANRRNPLIWLLSTWALVASLAAVFTVLHPQHFASPSPPHDRKRNVIFMVSDGMGPASLSLTRSFKQYRDELPIDDILTLDKHFVGHSRTRSSNSLITDSAAGATAFACGAKSYNGAISVLPNRQACGTILEAAKLNGYATGLVVTTRITDATPACFSAHANFRSEEDLIAQHQIGEYPLGRMVDLMIGGGRCHFLPNSIEGGCRSDDRDLIQEAVSSGWNYVGNLTEYKRLQGGTNVKLPLLGLLAPTDIPYDLDRNPDVHPSLEDTTRTALTALERATADSDRGFFIMIEGSRIDHAGHSNDPAAQVREVLAYDDAFRAAIEFAENSETETIVIATSDHETGGLAVAKQLTPDYPDYVWYPQALLNASHSGEYLSRQLRAYSGSNIEEFVKTEIFHNGLGIVDWTEEELYNVVKHQKHAQNDLVNMVSVRSQTGWSTHGHSAVDVNVYAFGGKPYANHELIAEVGGSNENTDLGAYMEHYLGVDLYLVTERLHGMQTSQGQSQEPDVVPYHH